jgi:hypothetical protein
MASSMRGESKHTAALIRGETAPDEIDRRDRARQKRNDDIMRVLSPQAEKINDAMTRHGEFFDVVAKMVIVEAKGKASGPSDFQSRDVARALGPESRTLSPGDVDLIRAYSSLPMQWNRAAAPLVRDYLDPNVPADRWVKQVSAHLGKLRAVLLEMEVCTLAIQDSGIRKMLREIVANYKAKLDCLTVLHIAVANGDEQAQLQAQKDLSEAGAEGKKLNLALVDGMRPHMDQVDQQAAADELRKHAKEIGELMKPVGEQDPRP